MRGVIHEIRNHLAIAVGNIEAFRDGVLQPSPARLDVVLRALRDVDLLLHDVARPPAPQHVEAGEGTAPSEDATIHRASS